MRTQKSLWRLNAGGSFRNFRVIRVIIIYTNYICLFDYLFISSQMSAKPYFIGSTGILLLW